MSSWLIQIQSYDIQSSKHSRDLQPNWDNHCETALILITTYTTYCHIQKSGKDIWGRWEIYLS